MVHCVVLLAFSTIFIPTVNVQNNDVVDYILQY